MSGLPQHKPPGVEGLEVRRYAATKPAAQTRDELAVEDPLEIVLCFRRKGILVRKPISITMRTPGMDEELAIGFLYTEGVIHTADAITNVEAGPFSSVTVTISGNIDLTRLERHFYTSSSCGVCGKTSLQALQMNRKIELEGARPSLMAETLFQIPKRVRQEQTIFESTGALHAAALFDSNSTLLRVCEDVGRHNAVDKLIGAELRSGRQDFSDLFIFVSGRAGFELVQKSLMSGIPFMAAVGAPSSLAVKLARKYGSTLVGFLRENRFNLYSGADRVRQREAGVTEVPEPVLKLDS